GVIGAGHLGKIHIKLLKQIPPILIICVLGLIEQISGKELRGTHLLLLHDMEFIFSLHLLV
ncbi:MAG: hypothetical protein AAFS00_13125, partial [Bacteroidota bacterium]